MIFARILALLMLAITPLEIALASANVEMEYFVHDPGHQLVNALKAYPELTFDHPNRDGYEVYGPKGTDLILQKLNANFWSIKMSQKDFADYPTFPQIEQQMKSLQARFPTIMKLFSIGKSSQGRDLWVMKISDNVDMDEMEPEVKYISSMHGNEITGRELMIKLIDEIGIRYTANAPEIKKLVDNTQIFIMPSMNPDGSNSRSRANGQGIDLNRDFPDFTTDNRNTPDGRAVETQKIMAFQASRNFALSANFHGGAEVVNYPWDTLAEPFTFNHMIYGISVGYANLVPYMRNSRDFTNGVTNGYAWYEVNGGMQDWSYHWYNDLQVTIELSNDKWPPFSEIPQFYANNRDALLYYLNEVLHGAGFFSDQNELSGTVQISAINEDNSLSDLGQYNFTHSRFYKVLENGNYKFHVETTAPTRQSHDFIITVSDDTSRMTNGNFYKLPF